MAKRKEIIEKILNLDTWVLASIFNMIMTKEYGSQYMKEVRELYRKNSDQSNSFERKVNEAGGIDKISVLKDFDISMLCSLMCNSSRDNVMIKYMEIRETEYLAVFHGFRDARNYFRHASTEPNEEEEWWYIWENVGNLRKLYRRLKGLADLARSGRDGIKSKIVQCEGYAGFVEAYKNKMKEVREALPQYDSFRTVEIDVRDQYQQYLDGIIVTISKNGNAIAKFTTLKSAAILQLETGTYSIEFNSAEYAIPGNQTFEVQENKKKYSFQANRKEATVTWMIVDDENNNPVKGMKVKVVGSGFNHVFCTQESAEQFKMPFGKYNVYSVEPSPDGYVLKNDCVEIREDKSIQMIAQREEDREAKEEEEKRAREAAERKRREEEEAREAEERKRKEEEKKAREAAERKRREEEKAREAEESKRKEEEKKAKEAEEKKRKEEADQTFCKAFAGILNEEDRKEHLPEYLQSLRTMAERGHEPSGLLLGFMYLNGLYVERDEKAGWELIGSCALSPKEYSGRAEKLLAEGNGLLSVIYMLGDAMIYENEERYIGVGIQFWIKMKNYEFCLACLKKGEKKFDVGQRRMFEKLCESDGRQYFEKVADSMQKDGR